VQLKFLLNSNVKGFCIIINFFLSVFMLNFGFNPTIKKSQKLKLKCSFSSLPCNEMYENCKTVFKLYEYDDWKLENKKFFVFTTHTCFTQHCHLYTIKLQFLFVCLSDHNSGTSCPIDLHQILYERITGIF